VDKVDKPSVCFFMLYYKRPELTRMSMWHMAKVLKKFRDAGHECTTVVVGDEEDQEAYCKKLGLNHYKHENNPLSKKFNFTFKTAVDQDKDYICWIGSNSVHSDEFWDKCLQKLKGPPVASFGSKNCTIVSNDFLNPRTKTWVSRHYSFCSCGQFYFTLTIKKTFNVSDIFTSRLDEKKMGFDAVINRGIKNKWGAKVFEELPMDPLDCVDVKGDNDIHGFEVYDMPYYKQHYTRDEVYSKLEELQMLESREFKYP